MAEHFTVRLISHAAVTECMDFFIFSCVFIRNSCIYMRFRSALQSTKSLGHQSLAGTEARYCLNQCIAFRHATDQMQQSYCTLCVCVWGCLMMRRHYQWPSNAVCPMNGTTVESLCHSCNSRNGWNLVLASSQKAALCDNDLEVTGMSPPPPHLFEILAIASPG